MDSSAINTQSALSLTATEADDGVRLDKFLIKQLPTHSRSYFQHLIEYGHVAVNGQIKKPSILLKDHDLISITFPKSRTFDAAALNENSHGIELIHEHPHFIILSKPAGLTVHPGNSWSTEISLVDIITARYEEIKPVGFIDRPGIVHRLDKDTSGIIIIARTNYAHGILGKQFHDRQIHKTYVAIVQGHPARSGTIDLAIGRDPHAPIKMRAFQAHETAIHSPKIRNAVSHYRVLEYFENVALVEIKPITGRTHQIRVHMAAIGHPIMGDAVYGIPSKLISRQALHAKSLAFAFDNQSYEFSKEMPEDMQKLLTHLRK